MINGGYPMQLLFHGPNDSNECRRAIRKLAREVGGKVQYTSFWCGRRSRWFSEDTVGKAAYSVRVDDSVIGSRDALAKLVRTIWRGVGPLKFIRADHHHFEGPLAKPGYHEAWSRTRHYYEG